MRLGLTLFMFPSKSAAGVQFISVKLMQVIYVLLFLLGIYLLIMGYGILGEGS